MISDEQLREAARQAEKNILVNLPEPKDCEAAFSPRFQRKMKKLILRTDHPVKYWAQKAAACILLVILLGGGIVLALSTEMRAAFAGCMREVRDVWFHWYTGESQSGPEDMGYCPTWLPDGYELEVKPEPGPHTTIIYKNAEGDAIMFTCSMNMESITLPIEQEDTQFSNVYVGNILADLYMDNTEGYANHLIWENEDHQMLFWIISTLNARDMIKIAESVSIIKNQQ